MDLALTEAQEMLKKLTRDFLEREFPTALLRELEADESGHSSLLWRQMADLGLTNVAFPETYGGAGGTLMDLGVVVEQMGRGLYTGPYFASVVLGGLTLLYGGSEAQKRDLLTKVGQGQALLSLALLEEAGKYEPASIKLQAAPSGGSYLLNGSKLFVEYGAIADYVLCVARTSPRPEGLTVFVAPRASHGLTVSSLKTIGGDKQAELTFRNVAVPSESIVGEADRAWPTVQRVLEVATALLAMQMAGMAEKVLEMTVEYVKARVQFGRPIGSFQAVQHHCANMAILTDGAKLAAQEAVSRLALGLPARKDVALAKAFCSRACQEVTLTAHQLHGGVGFMQEYDLQLYTRQMEGMALRLGTAPEHLQVVAQELGI